MASLDDIPTLPPTTPTSDDLIAIIDGADRRSPKRVSLAQVGSLVNGDFGSMTTHFAGGSFTITSRLTQFVGTPPSSITLPPYDGALRDVYIFNNAPSAITLPSLSIGSTTVASGGSAHLISNGGSWWRVS